MSGIHKCSKCDNAMVRAELYDPDGMMPLFEGIEESGSRWICINKECEDGRRNRAKVEVSG